MNAHRSGKTIQAAVMFLAACERGKRSIYISREYVVVPRAIWEDINRKTARHRVVSIDEGRVLEQPPVKEERMDTAVQTTETRPGIGKRTMEVRTLDDERRREICFALFNQVETADLESLARRYNVEVTALTNHEGR